MNRFLKNNAAQKVESVLSAEDILQAGRASEDVYIHPELLRYIAGIVHATRSHKNVASGVSPRGTLAFLRAVKAYAYIGGRGYVVPEDIQTLAAPVLAHRLLMVSGMGRAGAGAAVIQEIINTVPVPTEEWSKA
jgi:MoxR-like ATPase